MNFEASTFRNGELVSFASRRAISVLPTPVGPIMMMFLGMISSASSGESFCRRMRLRSAMATARLAGMLADDILVQLGDDLARRHLIERDVFFSRFPVKKLPIEPQWPVAMASG